MTSYWNDIFRRRMVDFGRARAAKPGEVAVSIKVRVASGCFHREHSPNAYKIIDRCLDSILPDDCIFQFEEHESGPEILMYLAVTTAGLAVAKSIIDLITAIIKARSDGVRQGDTPDAPLELIVRRIHKHGEFVEEKILRVAPGDSVNRSAIEKELEKAAKKLIKEEQKHKGQQD